MEKVRAITEAPHLKNVAELRTFLGLINYYGKFLPDLATVLNPLYCLLHMKVKWNWKEEQEKAFQEAKELLKSPRLLTHYDSTKDLILTCDASSHGVGAILSQRERDGTERPIVYYSRTLSPTEQRYSQLDKEALAIVAGVKKFHQYLAGRRFEINTDHKPLIYIFDQHRGISPLASGV